MNHKLYFLGSAGDIKSAGKNHSAGGLIVQTEGIQIHIDPGIGALNCSRRTKIDLRDTQVLISTNNYLVSSNEVNAVASYMTLDGEDRHGVLIGSSSVINGTENEPPVINENTQKILERIITIRANDKVGIGNVDIHATKINSKDSTSVGLIIESPVFKMGYFPHMRFSKTAAKMMDKVDILVINIKYFDSESKNDGLNLDEGIKIVNSSKPRLVIITGMGYKLNNEKYIKIIRKFQKETKIQTMVAEEGMILNASSYKKARQEKLL